ncbi:MAG: hypothetical protein JWQ70_504 [Aeromicrobium sp.]|nr:hypothetical protein [Aeromicrobium sp.]
MSRPTKIRKQLSIEQVQRWVITFLVTAVSLFPLGALVAVGHTIDDNGRTSDATILLCVMAVIGILALIVIRLVHRVPPLSPWVLCGALPAIAAAFVVL